MTQGQILVLVVLAIMVCIVFGVAAVTIRPLLVSSPAPAVVEQPGSDLPASSTLPATWTPVPTATFNPISTDTPYPTSTYTLVVHDTATPTPSQTPGPTSTPTSTPTPTRRGSGGSARPTSPPPTPTSRYPFRLIGEPVAYETDNHFFVILAKVTSGNVLLPGYRIVGNHRPTGAGHQSEPSCNYLCKASGPKGAFTVQEGNLVFEAPFYDTGTWSLVLLDPQGRQASELFKVEIDAEEKMWFYYHLGQ